MVPRLPAAARRGVAADRRHRAAAAGDRGDVHRGVAADRRHREAAAAGDRAAARREAAAVPEAHRADGRREAAAVPEVHRAAARPEAAAVPEAHRADGHRRRRRPGGAPGGRAPGGPGGPGGPPGRAPGAPGAPGMPGRAPAGGAACGISRLSHTSMYMAEVTRSSRPFLRAGSSSSSSGIGGGSGALSFSPVHSRKRAARTAERVGLLVVRAALLADDHDVTTSTRCTTCAGFAALTMESIAFVVRSDISSTVTRTASRGLSCPGSSPIGLVE